MFRKDIKSVRQTIISFFGVVMGLSSSFTLIAGTISGTIKDEQSNPLPGVTVQIESTSIGAITDVNGDFTIQDVQDGTYTLIISSVGYQRIEQQVMVKNGTSRKLSISMQESSEELAEVVVSAEQSTIEIQSKPLTIASINAVELSNQSLGAEQLLKMTKGVVIRQTGGLGNDLTINLDGLTGNAVRILYDGIPLEVYGGGINISNIPVDALQRIDIYKGVMPVEIGIDALGGGINLIPVKRSDNFLRTSYDFGSFNTHRIAFDAGKSLSNKIFFSLNSFVNYSDNDFIMRQISSVRDEVNVAGQVVPVEETIDARRFHNQHESFFVELNASIRELKWADQIKLAANYNYRFDENQSSQFLIPTAVGESDRNIRTFTQRIDYQKLFYKKLNFRYFVILSQTTDNVSDSTTNVYNWRGEILNRTNPLGAELLGRPTAREARNRGFAHRGSINYNIKDGLILTVSNYFQSNRIEGNDPLIDPIPVDGQLIDPNTVPSTFVKNIVGAELEYSVLNDKVDLSAMFKNYYYDAEAIDIDQGLGGTTIPVRKVRENLNGFGFATKYSPWKEAYIRISYERTARIPTTDEIFGNFANIRPNFNLRPERSDNLNLGIGYNDDILGFEEFSIAVDLFVRNQENLIRVAPFGAESARYVNEEVVDGKGIALTMDASPNANFKVKSSLTYQSNLINTPNANGAVNTSVQVPNQPILFGNLSSSYELVDIFNDKLDLQPFVNYFFTDRYSINEVSDLNTANPEFVIPAQHLVDAGFIVTPNIENLTFSLTVRNVFDGLIYDNFRIPRPGRNYSLKVTYSI